MKILLKLALMISVFLFLGVAITNAQEKPKNYWKPDYSVHKLDTLIESQLGEYRITTKLFCLNDSSVFNEMPVRIRRKLVDGYDVSHNYQSDIKITLNSSDLVEISINKETFSDSIRDEYLVTDHMINNDFIEYNTVDNSFLFSSRINKPDTDIGVDVVYKILSDGTIRILELK